MGPRLTCLCFVFSESSGRRVHRDAYLSPNKVNRYSSQHDNESGQRGGRLIYKQDDQDNGSADDIKNWNYRITKGFVRSLSIWTSLSQAEDAGDREDVENKSGRDNVVEQVTVEI